MTQLTCAISCCVITDQGLHAEQENEKGHIKAQGYSMSMLSDCQTQSYNVEYKYCSNLTTTSASWYDNVIINHEMTLKITVFFLNIFGDFFVIKLHDI